jgi:hypothetical protein
MRSKKKRIDFQVKINNANVQYHSTRKPLAVIHYDIHYELEMARKEFNIGVQEFTEMPGTSLWATKGQMTKSQLLALYRLSNRTEAVTQDIHARHLERKSKQRQ